MMSAELTGEIEHDGKRYSVKLPQPSIVACDLSGCEVDHAGALHVHLVVDTDAAEITPLEVN